MATTPAPAPFAPAARPALHTAPHPAAGAAVLAWFGACTAAGLLAWGWVADEAVHMARSEALAGFQQQVMPGSTATPARQALAGRYLEALPPALRQQLGDQVRQEQRAGTTAPGEQAFLLRRLALYEAALQSR